MSRPVILTLDNGEKVSTGCWQGMPDGRDLDVPTALHRIEKGSTRLGHSLRQIPTPGAQPSRVDLRTICSDVENQGVIGCCTAAAVTGVMEYWNKRFYGQCTDGSVLALYWLSRYKAKWLGLGDMGCTIRHTMKALAYFGLPPDEDWSFYGGSSPVMPPGGGRYFDTEPPAPVLIQGQRFRPSVYARLDTPAIATGQVGLNIKQHLVYGIPSAFGFFGFPSWTAGNFPGAIPYPDEAEQAIWGHAVCAVGYDDDLVIENKTFKTSTTGAFIIRNSWGSYWGDGGYGYLPYAYLLHDPMWAWDWWVIYSAEMMNAWKFN